MDLSVPLDRLPDPLPIMPVSGPFDAAIRPPGSKSLTNRMLLLAGLAEGESVLRGALADADDAERMIDALERLGARVRREGAGGCDLRVRGVGGRWRVGGAGAALNLNNAGTATRFLCAAALLADGPVTIDGNARMRHRPIGELVAALERLGARAEYLGRPACPPVRITPPERLPVAPSVELPTTLSSQFISALLLVGPWVEGGLTVRLTGPATSASYIEMTLGLLERLGASAWSAAELRVLRAGAGDARARAGRAGIDPFDAHVEPDASGATYFWAAAAMVPGARCLVEGIGRDSLQGDAQFPRVLARMGAVVDGADARGIAVRGPQTLRGIEADLSDMPDAAMTLAAAACVARGPTTIRGVRTLRVKETDRIAALQTELAKVGARVDAVDADTIRVTPPDAGVQAGAVASPGAGSGSTGGPRGAVGGAEGGASPGGPHAGGGVARVEFDTYDDHRMAMALALIGLRRANVHVRNPACVAKTYPTFWRDWARLHA